MNFVQPEWAFHLVGLPPIRKLAVTDRLAILIHTVKNGFKLPERLDTVFKYRVTSFESTLMLITAKSHIPFPFVQQEFLMLRTPQLVMFHQAE